MKKIDKNYNLKKNENFDLNQRILKNILKYKILAKII